MKAADALRREKLLVAEERQRVEELSRAATQVQSRWRGRKGRATVHSMKKVKINVDRKKEAEAYRVKQQKAAALAKKQVFDEQQGAATAVQSAWRAKTSRKEMHNRRDHRSSQESERKHQSQKHALRKKQESHDRQKFQRREQAAIHVQRRFRGWMVRKHAQIDRIKRERGVRRAKQTREAEKEQLLKRLNAMEARGKFGAKQHASAQRLGLAGPTEPWPPTGYLTEDAWATRRRDLAEIDRKLQEIEDRRVGSRARHVAQTEAAKWESGSGFTRVGRWKDIEHGKPRNPGNVTNFFGGPDDDMPRNRAQISNFLGVSDLTDFQFRPSPMAAMEAYGNGKGTSSDVFAPPALPRSSRPPRSASTQGLGLDRQLLSWEQGAAAPSKEASRGDLSGQGRHGSPRFGNF